MSQLEKGSNDVKLVADLKTDHQVKKIDILNQDKSVRFIFC